MTNKYDYLDDIDEYLDTISDGSIRQGVAQITSGRVHAVRTDEWVTRIAETTKTKMADPDIRQKMINAQNDWRDSEAFKDMRKRLGESKRGSKNSTFKGTVVGTDIKTGNIIRLEGNKAIKDAGFQYGNISKCISGERHSHRGYTWSREKNDE